MKRIQKRVSRAPSNFLLFPIILFATGTATPSASKAQQPKPIQFLFLKCTITVVDTDSGSRTISGGFPVYYRIPKEGQSIVYADYFGRWDQDKRQWLSVQRNSSETYTVSVDINNIIVKSTYSWVAQHSDRFDQSSYVIEIKRRTGTVSISSSKRSDSSSGYYRNQSGNCLAGEPNYNEVNKF